MSTAVFYGELANKYGDEHKFNFRSVWHLMQYLVLKLGDEFESDFENGKWNIIINNKPGKPFVPNPAKALIEQQVMQKLPANCEVHILPAIEGESNIATILIGAAILYFTWGAGGAFMAAVHGLAASLIIQGVVGIIASKPVAPGLSNTASPSNYAFGSTDTITAQGGPVPIVYGEVVAATSTRISMNISASNVPPVPLTLASSPAFPSAITSIGTQAWSNKAEVNCLNSGYWSISSTNNAPATGSWASNPDSNSASGAYEVQFVTAITAVGVNTPNIINPATSYSAITDDVVLIIDGSNAYSTDLSVINVTMNVRAIGTTTPVSTSTTTITLGWEPLSADGA